MPRWLWWAPVALVTVYGAVFAFRSGWVAANLTETDVINRFAAQYLKDAGAGASVNQCAARPSTLSGVWLVVTCTAPAGRQYRYFAAPSGARIVPGAGAPEI